MQSLRLVRIVAGVIATAFGVTSTGTAFRPACRVTVTVAVTTTVTIFAGTAVTSRLGTGTRRAAGVLQEQIDPMQGSQLFSVPRLSQETNKSAHTYARNQCRPVSVI